MAEDINISSVAPGAYDWAKEVTLAKILDVQQKLLEKIDKADDAIKKTAVENQRDQKKRNQREIITSKDIKQLVKSMRDLKSSISGSSKVNVNSIKKLQDGFGKSTAGDSKINVDSIKKLQDEFGKSTPVSGVKEEATKGEKSWKDSTFGKDLKDNLLATFKGTKGVSIGGRLGALADTTKTTASKALEVAKVAGKIGNVGNFIARAIMMTAEQFIEGGQYLYKASMDFRDYLEIGQFATGDALTTLEQTLKTSILPEDFRAVTTRFGQVAASTEGGILGLAKFATSMNNATDSVSRFGMSSKDLYETGLSYQEILRQTGGLQILTTEELTASTVKYIDQLSGIAKLTGKSRKEIQERLAQESRDASYQLKLRSMTDEQRKQAEAAMQQAMKTFPESAGLLKDLFVMGGVFDKNNPALQAAMAAGLTGPLQKYFQAVTSGGDVAQAAADYAQANKNIDKSRLEVLAITGRIGGLNIEALAEGITNSETMLQKGVKVFKEAMEGVAKDFENLSAGFKVASKTEKLLTDTQNAIEMLAVERARIVGEAALKGFNSALGSVISGLDKISDYMKVYADSGGLMGTLNAIWQMWKDFEKNLKNLPIIGRFWKGEEPPKEPKTDREKALKKLGLFSAEGHEVALKPGESRRQREEKIKEILKELGTITKTEEEPSWVDKIKTSILGTEAAVAPTSTLTATQKQSFAEESKQVLKEAQQIQSQIKQTETEIGGRLANQISDSLGKEISKLHEVLKAVEANTAGTKDNTRATSRKMDEIY